MVLPGLRGMPLADLEKLAQFVREGGSLIAVRRLPEEAYGWKDRKANTAKLQALVREMFAGPSYGKGRAVFVNSEQEEFRAALRRILQPDLQLNSDDRDVAFVHRQLPDQDFYFVANLGAEEKTFRPQFRAPGKRIEVWNPMDGSISVWDGNCTWTHTVPWWFGSPRDRPRS